MTRVASLLINQHALLLGFAVKNTLRGSRVTRVSLSVVASAPTEVPSKFLKNKRLVPESAPPSDPDLGLLYNFVNDSKKLVVLTGAGASTECGIPDYRSPHGAYSSGFKPITHQEFVRSEKARRRYWARSYAGWQKFNSVQPGATHKALANLEKKGRVYGMITQNVDRLHQKAGSNPIELHGTTHYVVCLSCGCITDRHLFQDRVKALNPEWALAIKHLEQGTLGKDPSVGLQVRPDGDIEIDEKFWEEKFYIPSCEGCGGVLKPNVVFFGDNVPRERANQAFSIVTEGDALLVVGSSLNTMSAYRLVNAARENCLPIAILNIGQTRADKLSTIKVEAHCGEALSRLLSMGSLAVPLINGLDFQRTDFPERCKDDYEAGFLIIDIVDAVLPSLEHEELNIIGQLQGNKLLSLTGEFGWKTDKDVLTRHRRNGRSQILTQDFLPYCI